MPRNILSDVITRQRAARVQAVAFSALLAAITLFSIASLTTAG